MCAIDFSRSNPFDPPPSYLPQSTFARRAVLKESQNLLDDVVANLVDDMVSGVAAEMRVKIRSRLLLPR